MLMFFSLLLSLLIYLFCFYYYTKDDLFFIRKGVTMDSLFNVLFLGLFWSVFFSRLVYYLLNPAKTGFSLIRFILIPYFPGMSVFGAITGLFIAYAWLTKQGKIARLRFFDYASVAILASFPILFLGVYFNYYLLIMFGVLFLFFINVLVPRQSKGTMKEGSICYIFLIMVSLVFLLQDIFLLYTKNVLLTKESFLFAGLFVLSCYMLVRLEKRKILKGQ